MPFGDNHPCDSASVSEFYETNEVRDAFYSKPNKTLKRNYILGVEKEKKACLQAEINKRYPPKPRRMGYNPVPKWTWYAIRYTELSNPINQRSGREICYNKPPKDDDIAMPRPAVGLKRGKRVKRNNRPGKLRAFAAMLAEKKLLDGSEALFSLPVSLYDWVKLAIVHEDLIGAQSPAHRGVLKRERELRLDRKRMEYLRCSRKEFLVEAVA